ncbi:hypothetical protein TNCV_2763941 [Trichonephila clavipes]|nr:hypothetical protein TNCV_2763941 [Trichonephila clavipes]
MFHPNFMGSPDAQIETPIQHYAVIIVRDGLLVMRRGNHAHQLCYGLEPHHFETTYLDGHVHEHSPAKSVKLSRERLCISGHPVRAPAVKAPTNSLQ